MRQAKAVRRTQSGAARHNALAEELSREIAGRGYAIGDRFPTEAELKARFEVGRHTVREALKILTEQGLLGRRQKTGTVVLAHRPVSHYVHSLRDLRGLFNFAQTTALDVRIEDVVLRSSSGSSEESGAGDRRWFRFAGLRSTRREGKPLCWSEILVPEQFAVDRDAVREGSAPVYEITMDRHGLKLDHVEQDITATDIPQELASVLAAEPGSAALMVKRLYVAHPNLTFEISYNLYPADRYAVRSIIRERA